MLGPFGDKVIDFTDESVVQCDASSISEEIKA